MPMTMGPSEPRYLMPATVGCASCHYLWCELCQAQRELRDATAECERLRAEAERVKNATAAQNRQD